jgi:hypothetical protein
MKIAFNQTGNARKKMVESISTALNSPQSYSGAPLFEYRIGDFVVDREGALSFASAAVDEGQLRAVLDALRTAGFSYEDSSSYSIGYPLEGFTPETIDVLCKMVQAKEALIKKALEIEALPIQVGTDEIVFPWLRPGLKSEETFAYAQFITALCKTAKTKKRAQAETKAVANEKFRMRIFCVSLGMVGPEFALARKLLGKNLSGNSAWSSGGDPRAKGTEVIEPVAVEAVPEAPAEVAPEE